MNDARGQKTGREKLVGCRTFLKGAGAVLVLAAGGIVYRAVDQGVFSVGRGPAYEPWESWREGGAGAEALVASAILASNAHNSQSWLFRVAGGEPGGRIDLFANRRRDIGAIDPFLREMYTSVGCALENLVLSAEANGYAPKVTLLPDSSDPSHAAGVDLSPAEPVDSELFRAIPERHTDRGPYDPGGALPPGTLGALDTLARGGGSGARVFWFEGKAERRRFGDEVVRASEALISDREQSTDSFAWFRSDWDEIQRQRSGPTLDANVSSPLVLAGAKMLPAPSRERGDEVFVQRTRDVHVATAAAFGILAVMDNRDDAQRLAGGRAWQRMHLWATKEGLSVQPLNQMTERADREAQLGAEPDFGRVLANLIGEPGWQALMPFRIGRPTTKARPSPRRALEDVLV